MKETLMKKNERGITLIALIITIVVLLILCGITINAALGDKGIVGRSKQFANQTNSTIEESMTGLNGLIEEYNETMNGKKIQSLIGKEAASVNQTVVDDFQNRIEIPAGFTVVPNGTDNVTYTYEKDEQGNPTGNPTVQDGIVIKNEEDGNQFVWVPVGDIKNNDGTTTTITLGRYVFGTDGTPELKQSSEKYTEKTVVSNYSNNFIELSSSSYGNIVALNLGEWLNQANTNGGYYIARYEASKNGIKAASKPSTGTPVTSSSSSAIINDGMLWNNITQQNASIAARNMYPQDGTNGDKYYSDLINSYAWDTAIVYIQKCTGDISYSKTKGETFSTSLQNTGTNEDIICNICDMASNASEWTTESCNSSGYPCTSSGGNYWENNNCTSKRSGCADWASLSYVSFRTTLYVK